MDITCEHCGLVMTEGEALAGVCPGCHRRMRVTGNGRVNRSVSTEEVGSNLIVGNKMSTLAKSMRKEPSRQSGVSVMRGLAWGAVVLSFLPWVITGMAIRSTWIQGDLRDVAGVQCLPALFVAGATIVMGLVASVNAAKEDQATPKIATFAVVLATFNVVIAGALILRI